MSALFHRHHVANNMKLQTVVARSQTVVASQSARQRFYAADFGPLFQADQQFENATVDRVGQRF